MKIIDFVKKGQSVRFLLGDDALENWYGDDWNDVPYEHNAGTVYDEFTKGYIDITFDFDDLVLEPSDDWSDNSSYCKNDMRDRRVPCVIVVPKAMADTSWDDRFSRWVGADGVKKFYFGDKMSPAYIYQSLDGNDRDRVAIPVNEYIEECEPANV